MQIHLSTFAIPSWHTEITSDLAGSSSHVLDVLNDRAGVLQAWRNAHTESEKSTLIAQDDAIRQRMLAELRASGNQDHPQLMSFARHRLLSTDAEPVLTDARLLFYRPDWTGFDIVIGNPPYEAIGKDKTAIERRTMKTRLSDAMLYQTTSGGDLYNLFCEVSLSLVKPSGGAVTLIVPLSIAFGKAQSDTRRVVERRSESVWLRHHDVRPGKIFHDSPVAHPESRQRVTIITCVTGSGEPTIKTTGTSKWAAAEREQFLTHRDYYDLPEAGANVHPNISTQWGRVPSASIGELISSMFKQRAVVNDLLVNAGSDNLIGLPQTGYEFLTAVPAGTLKRREIILYPDSFGNLKLAMALLNNHIAYMWWRVWGDAFDVNNFELTSLPIPDSWLDESDTNATARSLGYDLIYAVNPHNVQVNRSGTRGREFENVNFHEACPEIIAQIDELYLDALGLLDDELLTQLRKLRSSSNWRLE